jgi:hypothetical protein
MVRPTCFAAWYIYAMPYLLQIIIGTLISHFVKINERFATQIVGPIPTGYVCKNDDDKMNELLNQRLEN